MTIKELAKLADTSTAAVSLVLNDKWQKLVRPEIAERVEKLAKEHDFAINVAGRSLVMQRNFRIAICADSNLMEHPLMGTFSFHELMGVISIELSKYSYAIDILRLDKYENNIEGFNRRLKSNCDGAIFISPAVSTIKKILKQLDTKMPYVVVDCNLRNKSFNYFYTDMESSVKHIISSLARKGHKRIGIVRGEKYDSRFNQKLNGYKKALSIHKIKYLPELVIDDFSEDFFLKGSLAAEKILNLSKPPTAVLCTDNVCGIGFVQYANKNGINIPDDIELVGFGDEAISMFSRPRLTYLKRPIREMAEKAVVVLLEWTEGKNERSPLQCEFEEELIVQETAILDS